MDLPPEWPPEKVLAQARLKYGLLLATGQLGRESIPEVASHLWRCLRNRMATCDLDVVDHNGATALCRFMYTEYGFAICTPYDGGNGVHYRDVATGQWERLRQRQTGRSGGRQIRG